VETRDSEALDLNGHYRHAHDMQPVDVADAWGLDRYEFSTLKYLYRRGQKDGNTRKSDLLKAIWYLVYAISKDKKLCGMVIELVKLHNKYKEEKPSHANRIHKADSNECAGERPFEHWSN
jgi:hypothetical protein